MIWWLIFGGWGIVAIGFLFGWITCERIAEHHHDGTVVIVKYPDDRLVYTLELNKNPESWQHKKSVRLGITTNIVDDSIRE